MDSEQEMQPLPRPAQVSPEIEEFAFRQAIESSRIENIIVSPEEIRQWTPQLIEKRRSMRRSSSK